jgi:lipopolysaccharide transport system ATP-binding protein
MSSERDPATDLAIEVRHLSKCYRLYAEPRDRLRQAFQPRLARLARRFGLAVEERRYFAEHWALNDVSFQVRRGETMGILGRNGAGKSTLLQLICGTLTPTTGDVRVNGRVAALLELGSGFNPEFTGRENILLNASVLGLSREETLARMDDILAFADIGDFIDHPVKTYSSGMAMRVAFSVIAHVDADVLVVDEALSVGDAYFQQKCMRWLRQFQESGTVLFCGHDLSAVTNLCQRAVWIDKGRMRMAGAARDVAEAYASFAHSQGQGLPEENVTVSPALREEEAPPVAAAAVAVPEAEAEIIPSPHAGLRLDGNAFGAGQARITGMELRDAEGRPTALVQGGELVQLVIQARTEVALPDVIMGFQLKDRLGQVVFVQNNIRTRIREEAQAPAGAGIEARFTFRMPMLLSGEYGFGAAVASGSQTVHVMQHFLHEALIVHVDTPGHLGGLLTVPLARAELSIHAEAPA